jgi:hypothetical protein
MSPLGAYRLRLDYDPLFQFLAQGQMSPMGRGLFLEEKSLARVFIPGKPDDECSGDVSAPG